MLSNQLEYSAQDVHTLRRIIKFIAFFYVPAWVFAPVAANAAVNDLNDLRRSQLLLWHRGSGRDPALAAICRHLEYVTP